MAVPKDNKCVTWTDRLSLLYENWLPETAAYIALAIWRGDEYILSFMFAIRLQFQPTNNAEQKTKQWAFVSLISIGTGLDVQWKPPHRQCFNVTCYFMNVFKIINIVTLTFGITICLTGLFKHISFGWGLGDILWYPLLYGQFFNFIWRLRKRQNGKELWFWLRYLHFSFFLLFLCRQQFGEGMNTLGTEKYFITRIKTL